MHFDSKRCGRGNIPDTENGQDDRGSFKGSKVRVFVSFERAWQNKKAKREDNTRKRIRKHIIEYYILYVAGIVRRSQPH